MLPQKLEKYEAKLNGHKLYLMFAVTEEEQALGLMFRKSLPFNEGMLFIYDEPQIPVFWMKYTYIPLDLILFDSDLKVIEIIENMEPAKSSKNIKIYSASKPAQFALELPAGSISRFNIKLGDKLYVKKI